MTPFLIVALVLAADPSLNGQAGALLDINAPLNVQPRGLFVTWVAPDSPSAAAGMRSGDVVVSVAGSAVREPAEFIEAYQRAKPREGCIDVVVTRSAKTLTLCVRPKPDFAIDFKTSFDRSLTEAPTISFIGSEDFITRPGAYFRGRSTMAEILRAAGAKDLEVARVCLVPKEGRRLADAGSQRRCFDDSAWMDAVRADRSYVVEVLPKDPSRPICHLRDVALPDIKATFPWPKVLAPSGRFAFVEPGHGVGTDCDVVERIDDACLYLASGARLCWAMSRALGPQK